jgi:hypothetical protein
MERKDRPSPIISALEFYENIDDGIDTLQFIMVWAILTAGWMIIVAITFFIGIFDSWSSYAIVLGAMLGIFSPLIIYRGIKAYMNLNSSVNDFFPIYYIIKMELFPPMGESPEEKIWNKLKEIYTSAKEVAEEEPDNVQFNVKVKGKRIEHHFNIYVLIPEDPYGDIFVRRFDKDSEVDEGDLSKLRDEILDVCKKTRHGVHSVTCISTTPYASSAINYVKNKGNWVKGIQFDLIKEKPKGYEVIWAGY